MAVGSGNNTGRMQIEIGRKIRWSPTYDSRRDYLSNDLTPERLTSLLVEVDDGDIAAMAELQEEMEGKDAHLQGVSARRREALTALDWKIEPPENTPKDQLALAQIAADYCDETLRQMSTWAETLEHLATATGPGVAAVELVWRVGLDGYALASTNDIPGHRLIRDIDSPDIWVITDEKPQGQPAPPGKYVMHLPNSRAGFPFRVTLTRAQGYLFLMRHFSLSDWASFLELFGMPVRWGKVDKDATPAERTMAESFVRDMTTDAWGTASSVDLQLIEANRGVQPFSDMVDWIESKTSILWLGQTLTTEMGSVGSFAAAQVHQNVKASILKSDVKNERRTIREQILRPMVALRFPGTKAIVPEFNRQILEAADVEGDRLKIDKLTKAGEMQLPIDVDVQYDMLGIPQPAVELDEVPDE